MTKIKPITTKHRLSSSRFDWRRLERGDVLWCPVSRGKLFQRNGDERSTMYCIVQLRLISGLLHLLHLSHPVWELHVAQRLSRHRRRQPRPCAGAHCCGEQGADQAESPPLVISADDLRQWCFLFRRRKKARRRRLERDCRFVKKFRLLILELGKDFQWDVFAGEAAC